MDRTDRSVLFVAISRHKQSLTILIDIPEPVEQTAGPAKVQSTLDLAALIYTKN